MLLFAPWSRANDFLAAACLPFSISQVRDSGMKANAIPVQTDQIHWRAKTVRNAAGEILATYTLMVTSPIACMSTVNSTIANWIGPRRRNGEISEAQEVAVARTQPMAKPLTIFPASNMPRLEAVNWIPIPATDTHEAPTHDRFRPIMSETKPIPNPPMAWSKYNMAAHGEAHIKGTNRDPVAVCSPK